MGFHSAALSARLTLTKSALGPLLGSRWGKAAASLVPIRRNLMTPLSEVEPTSNVPERPVTLVLAEDEGLYEHSWHETFEQALPKEHGIQYSKFALGETSRSFDSALQELKKDLSPFLVDTVLVARGPWMSWMAQFYLEDLPLKGLALVDPMQLDDTNGINQFQLWYEKHGLASSQQYQMFQEYTEHWGHWTLQLEPGSVPMTILYTTDRPAFKRCAKNTALRHSVTGESEESVFEDIPIVKLIPARVRGKLSPSSHANDAAETIATWINDRVL